MSTNARARRTVARQPLETFDEWIHQDRRPRLVSRGELIWFLDMFDETQRRRAHDNRWYRRAWRALLRPFRGRRAS